MKNLLKTEQIIERESEFIPEFSKIPYGKVVLKSGCGATLEDYDGKTYIDFLSSASSANLGHGNQRIANVVADQMKQLANYTSAYFYTEPVSRLAKELVKIAPGDKAKKVAFGMSGSDSIDGMIKLVRAYTGRPKIISFVGSYHGSTIGAISLSAISTDMKRKIGPLIPEIYHFQYPTCYQCPYGQQKGNCALECIDEIKRAFDSYLPADEVAAIVIEPIAGDAGLIVPPIEYMKTLKNLCEANGILFVVDEIQQALGRTGKWFSIEHFDIVPDVIVMGKSLGAGLPLSAIIASTEIMGSLNSPAHLFTMSGNATTCAAAYEQLNIIREKGLLNKAEVMGEYIKKRLTQMQRRHSVIGQIRGIGLSIGVELVQSENDNKPNNDAAVKICHKSIELGLLQIYVGKSTLRIQPPLIITKEEVDKGLDILAHVFDLYERNAIDDACYENVSGW